MTNDGGAGTGEGASNVATADKAATYLLDKEAGSFAEASALELTVRPEVSDPDASFLVQVFVSSACATGRKMDLLGSFSFFRLLPGEAQTFVLPTLDAPEIADDQGVELAIKLVPANPARDLGNTAVEVLDAHLVR